MVVYIDGGARGNPGPAAIGFVVFDDHRSELHRYGTHIGVSTNNCAEYTALIEALSYLVSKTSKQDIHPSHNPVIIYCDSELIVRQMNGNYRVRDTKLRPLHKRACELMDNLHDVCIRHVPRGENLIADGIVNRVLDGHDDYGLPIRPSVPNS